jgi:hypothetical protein
METTFALNVLQKLSHCCTDTHNFFFRSITRCRRFVFIDIGAHSKKSVGGTFSASILYYFLEGSESSLPKPASFEGSGT